MRANVLFWELRWGIAGLIGVITFGVAGYHQIEGWNLSDSLWMVIITLTTIGYGEVKPLTEEGRLFTLLVIIGGVSTGTYTLGKVTRYVIEGGLIEDLRSERTRRKMKKLNDHYIVVGLGRLGREVIAELTHAGRAVVGIDTLPERIEQTEGLRLGIVGDGSSDSVLTQAAIERARGMAIATKSSAINIYVTLSARQLNPDLHILTRVDDEGADEKALRAGADEVIRPYGISGTRMAQGLLRPHAANFVDLAIGRSFGDFALEDIAIGKQDEYHGKLSDLDIPKKHRVMVIAIRKAEGQLLTAIDKDTLLDENDVAVVIGRPADIGTFAVAAGGAEGTGRSLFQRSIKGITSARQKTDPGRR